MRNRKCCFLQSTPLRRFSFEIFIEPTRPFTIMSGIIVRIIQIVIAILIPFTSILINFLVGAGPDEWYENINKPSWNPPSYLFAPVWSTLYAAMGYASFRAWDKGGGFTGKAKYSLIIYAIQLILNATWQITFFKLQALGWAVVHIVAILILIVINAIMFYRIDKIAGFLFIPYIAWVSFATVLSTTIWRLNA